MGSAPHFPSCRFLLDGIKVRDEPGLRHLRYIKCRVKSTACFPWHLSVQMTNTTTARLRHQRPANASDLEPLFCNSSKLPLSKMNTRRQAHATRSIRASSPRPYSSLRANKILRVRIYHRSYGSHVTLSTGQPGKPQIAGAKQGSRDKPAISEREATRLDWMRRLRPKPHRRC